MFFFIAHQISEILTAAVYSRANKKYSISQRKRRIFLVVVLPDPAVGVRVRHTLRPPCQLQPLDEGYHTLRYYRSPLLLHLVLRTFLF